MPSEYLPDHFPIQYDSTWQTRLQQVDHVFGGKYVITDVSGEKKKFNQSGELDMREVTGRALATQVDERDSYHRWIVPKKYELVERFSEWDEVDLGSIVMPTGETMMQHIYAYNRKRDEVCRDALEGNAITGVDGTTLTALPSSQIVVDDFVRTGSAVQSGLTFAKVGRMARIFNQNYVPKTDRYGMITSIDEEDLIQDVAEAKNSGDFGVIPTVPDGMIDGKRWYGFVWGTYEDLTTASSITNCLFWQKMGLIFGDGQRRTYTDVLPTFSHALQLRETARMAGLRREEKYVGIIETYHA